MGLRFSPLKATGSTVFGRKWDTSMGVWVKEFQSLHNHDFNKLLAVMLCLSCRPLYHVPCALSGQTQTLKDLNTEPYTSTSEAVKVTAPLGTPT